MTYLFVYGTLKKGFGNHVLLDGCRFMQEATTKPFYRLYDCGPYPCLVKAKQGRAISGEVYEVDDATLKRLDRLEGVPFLYQRDTIELSNCDRFFPIAYFYQEDVSDFIECDSAWPR